MVNNTVEINVDHVTYVDKKIADKISCVESGLALTTEMKKKSTRIIPLCNPVNGFTHVSS